VGPCCYPVDAALRDRFAAAFGPEVVHPPAVDLAAAARVALARAGVPASAVQVVEACTACEGERFYSHRRDGAATGRHAGVVWIDGARPA
jgi:copper oxidase (laccase) domain-containing protein